MYCKSILSSLINGVRVDTMEVRFPRIILPEFNTHRVFSRNFQSSRAKPILKVIEQDLTYTPSNYGWRKNAKGMSPSELFNDNESYALKNIWLHSKESAISEAIKLHELGVAKEIVNRLLEPFMEVTGIVTSTDWNNFFELRCHESAQTEIRVLANIMKDTYEQIIPVERDYHLPYIQDGNCFSREHLIQQIKQSIARCARVSYFSFDKKESELEKDIELFNRLKESKHLSPFEHVVLNYNTWKFLDKEDIFHLEEKLNGNFYGEYKIIQFRKLIELGIII